MSHIDYAQRRERDAAREAERRASEDVPVERGEREWLSDQPGHPLGVGVPLGTTLRLDGESHSNAWRRILRSDPCAYCGAPVSGTVDHVVPRASGQVNVERWINLVGACEVCNRRKAAQPLLLFLAGKRGLLLQGMVEQKRAVLRARPDRTEAEAEEIAKAQLRHVRRRKYQRYAA